MSKKATDSVLYWIRSDLRIFDNLALWEAAKTNKEIIVIYIKNLTSKESSENLALNTWINKSLQELSQRYRELYNIKLKIYNDDIYHVIEVLHKETNFTDIYINTTFDPEVDKIDAKLAKKFNNSFVVNSYNSSLLFKPNEILNNSGDFFKVYTPFWKKALGKLSLREPLPIPKINAVYKNNISALKEVKITPPNKTWQKKILEHFTPGELTARYILNNTYEKIIGYSENRDFPIKNNTSQLSPYLARGELTVNEIFFSIKKKKNKIKSNDFNKFLAQLGWREFSYNILYNFPNLSNKNFISKFDNFPWKKNETNFKKWKDGNTGFPIVDAGMRELKATGYMHNRLRMIVASFLVKNLNISWVFGAKWFWENLFDADVANNFAGWQWVAGCGTDAAPYFRIFNPMLQSTRFDKEGNYIRKWIPELKDLPSKYIHAPWEMTDLELAGFNVRLGKDYPRPIVDHKTTRDEALKNYKKMNNLNE
ncbi:DNA photolyase family protein [Pelagibacteraceae bacterium]|nr:DNA photolyase family protein [Pelagibacteraceae bacterium]